MSRSGTIAQFLAEFVDGTRYEQIPPEVLRKAKYLLLDAVGIALAASRYEFAQRELLALQGLASGDSVVIGMRQRLSLRDAMLMNGSLVHGLDYDDTYLPGSMHLSASAVPCALGLGSALRSHGRDVLAAMAIGMEVSARVSAAGRGGFQQAGFHPTGVAGTFGSALLAARLWRLGPGQMVLAQGIALSTACGSVQPMLDGTWTKRMHPGWAAASATTACAMARQGFLGPAESYEGKFGLYALYLGEFARNADLSLVTDGLGRTWEFARSSVKLFPACHQAHCFMNAAIAIGRERPLTPEDVESVTARIALQGVNMVCEPLDVKRRPHDSYAAQFSLPYTVSRCLQNGSFGLADLEPAALQDCRTLALAAKVGYEVDAESGFPKYRSGEVIVRMRDGSVLRSSNRIMPDDPVAEGAIEAKFLANAGIATSRTRAQEILEGLLGIETQEDVAGLTSMLAEH